MYVYVCFTMYHILLFSENTTEQERLMAFTLKKLRIYEERYCNDRNYTNNYSLIVVTSVSKERQNV